MKLALAALYRNFDVERIRRASDVRELFSFTMSPVGLRVRLRARRPGADVAAAAAVRDLTSAG
jgi:hypothetical protein